ncbi:hypothetical protein SS1G_00811 [Sclerotinia sclerotiorum 1980 UF-70]|uniref:Uncharacterized protein n=2 Tax=Sclerotinia sclerotiorum (strain ATCC 18683 / 1980 / Ss-1) TaxID=665079 RepID=A0A1D9PY87_SCLS1|nr:hypothetical protein SS1G_00811 [Sclerotinia sclerotiorum 1980 UF-70]APA07657.1 hypothetical protein sscle_03g024270 [Sclerotinia sclerotiorum 1980 UF-70]EDN91408.1 hypothetical protein SS1G_00811 [Sclerotinia sclerotiorum 1980 UF-70]
MPFSTSSILCYFSLISTSTSAPFLKPSNETTTGWVADPNGRGTLSLVISCLLTLSLCVWSAMHLNIPRPDHPAIHEYVRGVKWGIVGVFAPELVVFAAWRQYNSAAALRDSVQKRIAEGVQSQNGITEVVKSEPSKQDGRFEEFGIPAPKFEVQEIISPWTTVHGFYAGMGGFVFDFENPSDNTPPFIPPYTRLTLTARGVSLLAQCGHLPTISKREIVDKSKADTMAKLLVILQAGWMLVQVIGRLVAGLPVTLLEVNTLGHVLCAFIIYLLWWHKPRSIMVPTKLEGDWVKPLCAYMYMSSQISGHDSKHPGILKRSWKDSELSRFAYVPPETNDVALEELVSDVTPSNPTTEKTPIPDLDTTIANLHKAAKKSPHGFFVPSKSYLNADGTSKRDPDEKENAQYLRTATPEQLARWHLAAQAIHTHPALSSRFTPHRTTTNSSTLNLAPLTQNSNTTAQTTHEPLLEQLLSISSSNWPSEDLLRSTGGLIMGMTLWLASILFGSVHVAAWYDYFPTLFEQWMWRASAIYIIFSGALWLCINGLARASKRVDEFWDRFLALRVNRVVYAVIGSLCTVCGVAYVVARIYLVVEAFVSIRKLPVGAYGTPDWTVVVPHL